MSGKRWLISVALTVCHVSGQGSSPNERISARCAELNQIVIAQIASGELSNAEASLSVAAVGLVTSSEHTCEGLILSNMAAVMSITGRFEEAEQFAERSIRILAKDYSSNDLALLRPLHILAGAQLEQGNIGKARATLNRMRSIQSERPEDRELVHGMAAAQLQAEGKLTEAEPEYLATLGALEEAGQGSGADAGAVLTGLGSLYIEERRLDEARQALDRGLGIFVRAKDSAPMDRIKLLNLRAVLHVRQGEWLDAERDLSNAVSMAERESQENSGAFVSLLTNYARVLRRNHHRREARTIEGRAAVLDAKRAKDGVVDVSELFVKSSQPKTSKH
ncbi:MAG TPA: tetratricopeptide repeat protein [Verrucomicrobiae bacterium]|nr:tetratricopeptide repeat protein [Verrucomicrobiae bacterium]